MAVIFERGNKVPANCEHLYNLDNYQLSRGNNFFNFVIKIYFHRLKIKISAFLVLFFPVHIGIIQNTGILRKEMCKASKIREINYKRRLLKNLSDKSQ